MKKLFTSIFAAFAALVAFTFGAAQAAKKPNVILFLVDDMGWMDCEPYGSQYYETPNLSRLAEQGMRFTQAYAAPACSPTRASILTGQNTARHGVTGARCHLPPRAWLPYPPAAPPTMEHLLPMGELFLDPDLPTLAQSLKAAGYRTGHFGKWHLGLLREHWPDRYGFDEIWHCSADAGPPRHSYFSPYGVHSEGEPSLSHPVGNITDGPEGEHITDRLTEEAIGFITANKDRPFYLNLWHYSVHSPWEGKAEEMEHFAQKTDPTGRQGNPIMASMLKTMDDSLGRVLEHLEQLGIAENTVLIFMSDNGGNTYGLPRHLPETNPVRQAYDRWAHGLLPTSNAPLRAGKLHLYEGGTRVPLIVRWPGHVPAGTVRDDLVAAEDLFPTILDLLNLPAPHGAVFDGISFLPALDGGSEGSRKEVFTWWPYMVSAKNQPPISYPGAALRSGDWKLIRFCEDPGDEPRIQLYNLRDDISETKNLAAQHPERVAELSARIDKILADSGTPLPKPNPAFKKP